MDFNLSEWLNLAVRWFHVFAGILWVGQTYFFTWLDSRFAAADDQVWMVHSGGFYVVEKQKQPSLQPRTLHWFKWEAALTWLSGMFLLVIVYYLGGALLDSTVADISLGAGIGIGLGVIVVGWVVYDLLWLSPLARREWLGAVVCFGLLVGVAWGLLHLLSARAAYIHIGALLGTIMTANVWQRILPAQRRMLAALKAGEAPDLRLGARAKQRSMHNTYMVVPLVFLMISNHFPVATYGNSHSLFILTVLLLVGAAAARVLRWSWR